MIVNRRIPLNPVEPSPLSLRVADNIPVTVNIEFKTAVTDDPIGYDLHGKLVLTGRTNGQKLCYDLLSTDVSNGKAEATIPEGSLTDWNGYQLRVFGDVETTDGVQETLIAMGVLRVIEGGP